jgi:hypothetical protein
MGQQCVYVYLNLYPAIFTWKVKITQKPPVTPFSRHPHSGQPEARSQGKWKYNGL